MIGSFQSGDTSQISELHLHQSFSRFGWVLLQLRSDKAVVEMLQRRFIKMDQSWTRHTYSQDIQYLYGRCLLNHGDAKQATKLLEQVVETQEKMLSPAHPDRLDSIYMMEASASQIHSIDIIKGGSGSHSTPNKT